MARPEDRLARMLSAASLWSCRHPRTVALVTLALTLVAGYGVTLVSTDVDLADVLPRGDPNTAAAHRLTEDFRSTMTQQVTLQLHVDESGDHWAEDDARLRYRLHTPALDGTPGETAADAGNITDEVYVRAMEELTLFIKDRTVFVRQGGVSNLYNLVNWTLAGGEDGADASAFRLPGSDTPEDAARYRLLDQTVKASILDSVDAVVSPRWDHAATLFAPASDETLELAALGRQMIQARDDYVAAVAAGDTEFTVWGPWNPPLLTVDLPVADAHSSDLIQQDMLRLLPLTGAFILVSLFLAFRDTRGILVSATTLGVGVVWTYGVMGYMGIALNTLNMTLVPLIMGVGIDYAIHMINEFLEHKSEGLGDEDAFRTAGGRAGSAMFIATATTVLGLLVMTLSPSLLMAQLGLLSAIAIGAIFLLTIIFVPAALTLMGTRRMGRRFRPSRFMPWLARSVGRGRVFVVIGLVALTAAAAVATGGLEEEAFGDPGKNFRPDDPIRREHEEGLSGFYSTDDPAVKVNLLTFEGDILTPESMAYMRRIEAGLREQDRVITDTLRTVPFFLEMWLTVKGGAPCVAAAMASGETDLDALAPLLGPAAASGVPCAEQVTFPATEAALRAEVEAMFASPMAELSAFMINHPTSDMGAMLFSVRADSYDDAKEVWQQVWAAVDAAGPAPDDVSVAFVGNTATNYLFVEKELPWLQTMGLASSVVLAALVAFFTRSVKATVAATLAAALTSLWWLGVLPSLGIGLAVTLMLPLVFIFNIGTDYVVHLVWSLERTPDPQAVYASTGKAILYSAITTAGAFASFTLVQNVAVSRTMVATTVSLFTTFAATMLLLPLLYRTPRADPAVQQPL